MRKKKYILSEEQKARNKIYKAKWYKNNSEKKKANDARFKENNPDYIPPCRIENPDYDKKQSKRFKEANPGYSKAMSHKHDLGYWVVYIISNYNGLGDNYCGQTQNIHRRMAVHKSKGTLNSDKYELIKQCETLEDALEFEAYMHEQGYHGSVRTESGT